jgi:hypothetical protein
VPHCRQNRSCDLFDAPQLGQAFRFTRSSIDVAACGRADCGTAADWELFEIGDQFVDAEVALFRPRLDAAEDDPREFRLVGQQFGINVLRQFSRHQFVQCLPHRINVGRVIDAFGIAPLLGRHVTGCPQSISGTGRRRFHVESDPRQTEIDDLRHQFAVFLRQQDVSRFDIAMDEIAAVGVTQPAADSPNEPDRLGDAQFTSATVMVVQRPLGHQFHDDVMPLVVAGLLVHGDDVPMAELRHGQRLAQKAFDRQGCLRMRRISCMQPLDGNGPLQIAIERSEHGRKPPTPERLLQIVTAGQRHKRRRRFGRGHLRRRTGRPPDGLPISQRRVAAEPGGSRPRRTGDTPCCSHTAALGRRNPRQVRPAFEAELGGFRNGGLADGAVHAQRVSRYQVDIKTAWLHRK